MNAPLTPAQCTCIHAPETDAGQALHASYCVAATPAALSPEREQEIRAFEEDEHRNVLTMGRDLEDVLAELDRTRDERNQFADRHDALTAVAKGNKRHVQMLMADLAAAQASVAELENAAFAGHTIRLVSPIEQIQHLHAAVAAQMARAETLNMICREQRKRADELESAAKEIRHLHTDSPMGPCPVCIDGDALAAGEDYTVGYPCPTARLAGAKDCDPPIRNAAGSEGALLEQRHQLLDPAEPPLACPGPSLPHHATTDAPYTATPEAHAQMRAGLREHFAGDAEASTCTCMPHRKFACGHCDMDLCNDCSNCCKCECAEGGAL